MYSQEEIKDMLDMIHDGNRMTRSDGKPEGQSGGLKPIVKAYGIVGFIRFLDCYYLTLITRRAKVGSIGDNSMYTIKVSVHLRTEASLCFRSQLDLNIAFACMVCRLEHGNHPFETR